MQFNRSDGGDKLLHARIVFLAGRKLECTAGINCVRLNRGNCLRDVLSRQTAREKHLRQPSYCLLRDCPVSNTARPPAPTWIMGIKHECIYRIVFERIEINRLICRDCFDYE